MYNFLAFLIEKVKNNEITSTSALETKYEELLNDFSSDKEKQKSINRSLEGPLLEHCYKGSTLLTSFKEGNKKYLPQIVLPLMLSGEFLQNSSDGSLPRNYDLDSKQGALWYLIKQIFGLTYSDISLGRKPYKNLLLKRVEILTLEDRLLLLKLYIEHGGLKALPSGEYIGDNWKPFFEREKELSQRDSTLLYAFFRMMGPLTKKVMQRSVHDLEESGLLKPGTSSESITFLKNLGAVLDN